MSVTPEERAKWRAMCTPQGFDFEVKIIRLLNALEAAETERAFLIEILAEEICPEEEGQCGEKGDTKEECIRCWNEWLEKNHDIVMAPA